MSAVPAHRPEVVLGDVVFADDNRFYRDSSGSHYSLRGAWPWPRYLAISETVTVAARLLSLPDRSATANLAPVDVAGVRFEGVPSLTELRTRFGNYRRAAAVLDELLHGADGLIARLPSEIGSLAVRVAEKRGKPWAIELATCAWGSGWHYGDLRGKLFAPYSWFKTRRHVSGAPFVHYVTRQFLQRRYPTRGRAIGCSDIDLTPDPQALERRMRSLPHHREPFVVGLVGYLNARFKGIDTALQALSRIRDDVPPFRFKVLGPGDPRRVERVAAGLKLLGSTELCGVVPPGPPVMQWLDDVDLYIQPSFLEGLPRALLEAMSRGCPALGSTAGGIPELLDPDCLHSPGDVMALARLLRRGMTDVAWREQQAMRNFDMARSYSSAVLDRTRDDFWRDFARFASSDSAAPSR